MPWGHVHEAAQAGFGTSKGQKLGGKPVQATRWNTHHSDWLPHLPDTAVHCARRRGGAVHRHRAGSRAAGCPWAASHGASTLYCTCPHCTCSASGTLPGSSIPPRCWLFSLIYSPVCQPVHRARALRAGHNGHQPQSVALCGGGRGAHRHGHGRHLPLRRGDGRLRRGGAGAEPAGTKVFVCAIHALCGRRNHTVYRHHRAATGTWRCMPLP